MSGINSFFSKIKSFGWSRLALIAIFLTCSWMVKTTKVDGFGWKMVEGSDGTGYYSYLPATYIYHDFTFHFIDSLGGKYPPLGYAQHCGFCNMFDGNKVNKYFAGESVLLTPFFLVAHLASGSAEHPADGYSFFYVLAICVGVIFYLMFGLWSVKKLLQRYQIPDGIIALVLLCTFLGTSLFYYTVWEPEMSHVYSFGIIAFFFLQLHKQLEQFKTSRFILLSFLLGLIIILRPINAMVVLFIPFFAGNPQVLKTFFLELFRRPFAIFSGLIAISLVISIQLLYYHLQSGHWFVYSYGKEGFDFSNPHFFGFLFSYCNGFFVYAPLMFIATLGIFTFLPKKSFQFFSLILPLCIVVYVFSCWWIWNYAGAYGMRPMVEYLSLFALMFALFLQKISSRRFILPAISILILLPLAALSQFQIWQYRNGIIGVNHMTSEKYWFVFLEGRKQFYFINAADSPEPMPQKKKLIFSRTINFEHYDSTYDNRSVITGKGFSGNHCLNLKDGSNYSPVIKIRLGDYFADSLLSSGQLWVNGTSQWMLEDNGSESRLDVIVGTKESYKLLRSEYVIHQLKEENKWGPCAINVPLPPLTPDDTLRFFPERNIWFPVYVDDLTLNIYQNQ